MVFGVEPCVRIKYIFVTASDLDSTHFSARERGQAMSLTPKFEENFAKFVSISARVQITSPDECTVAYIIDALRRVAHGMDADLITMERYKEAAIEHREQHPELEDMEHEREVEEELVEVMEKEAPRPQALEPVQEPRPSPTVVEAARRLRKRVKVYSPGDVVELYNVHSAEWVLDGEVVDVASETINIDGQTIVAGSMKVEFNGGANFEWVAPAASEELLRPSLRPKPPPPVMGVLLKETHSWHAFWHKRYIEVSKGFLRWWESEEKAQRGKPPRTTVYMLGLQQELQGETILIRARNTKGQVYSFKANTEAEAQEWSDALWAHAGHCQEVKEFVLAKDGIGRVKSELVNHIHVLHGGGQRRSLAELAVNRRSSM